MKICMIGGTGLLGSQGAAELISRGHEVREYPKEVSELDVK